VAIASRRVDRGRAGKSPALIERIRSTGSNVQIAIECFKSSPRALASASLEQFEAWARSGAELHRQDRRKAQAYYALESKSSQESLRGANEGVTLESVAHLLRLYVEGLTGREMTIGPIGSLRHRPAVRDRLLRLGSLVAIASDIAEGMRLANERSFELILIDLADDRGALASIRMLRAVNPDVPLAGIVDPTRPATAAEALRAGLAEVMPWPFDEHDVMATIANTRDRQAIDTDQLAAGGPAAGLFAQSPVMRQVLDAVRGAAASGRGLFIVGEPGTGREAVARTIHAQSAGTRGAFVSVDCASSPAQLEKELFGTVLERPEDGWPVGAERLSAASAVGISREGRDKSDTADSRDHSDCHRGRNEKPGSQHPTG
jgi:CheY-like chemotaxis protein